MKNTATLILSLMFLTSYAQSIDSITEKISDKICECMENNIRSYSDLKPEFDRCYDLIFNQIFSYTDSDEHKTLVQQDALGRIKDGIIPTLNNRCQKIKDIIQSDVEDSIDLAVNSDLVSCPTNFTGKDLKKIKELNGEIIALEGTVTEVHTAHQAKLYYRVRLDDGNTVWVASLFQSDFPKEGKPIRILGFVAETENDEIAKKHNETDYHILAFCIVDLESKEIMMLPGSEAQVKEWVNGKIPQKR